MQLKMKIIGAIERAYQNRAGETREVIDLNMALIGHTANGTEYTEEIVGSMPNRPGLFEQLKELVESGTPVTVTFYMHTDEREGGKGWWQSCRVTNIAKSLSESGGLTP